jgi:alkylation response protein AidB-like acyl-CoA dehydrogenase
VGAGLARDADDAVFQLHPSDAIAGKPAPTFERDCQTDIEEPRVTAKPHSVLPSPLQTAKLLAAEFALTAVERDERGGTPKAERDALRQSGLLALSIPTQYGGLGARWSETLGIVREFAKVDSSIAHVFGFHHLMLATVRLFARPDQWQPWFEQTARKNWFWGNALNPLDTRTLVKDFGGWREFSGKKSFCSGASDSEMLIASAVDESAGGKLLIAAIPSGRSGITLHNDWNNIGQRQTDSGSASFERVRVEESELLLDPGPLSTPFACLRPLIAQLTFTYMFLGIAEGAFEEARNYTLTETRAWHKSSAGDVRQDPYVQHHYGEFWVALQGVRLLVERAGELLDQAWAKGASLSEQQRGELAIAIATAKVAATRQGLDLCSRLFEVTGARSTHASLRLDRHWRNLRTQTLHDPVDYKLHELGDWALNQSLPIPTFYS